MARRRVDVDGYGRVRRGRSERVSPYTREQEVKTAGSTPSMMALRRRPGSFPRTTDQQERALDRATRELSRLQRKVNRSNSSAVFAEAVDELMASLRAGDPNLRLANDLAAHVQTLRKGETTQDATRHQIAMAEEYPGQYVAHGYITKVQNAYDILDDVRHQVVFEYGGRLPGNITEFRSEGTAEDPSIGVYQGGVE